MGKPAWSGCGGWWPPAPDSLQALPGGKPPWIRTETLPELRPQWNGLAHQGRGQTCAQSQVAARQCSRSAGPPDGEAWLHKHCSIPCITSLRRHLARSVARPRGRAVLEARPAQAGFGSTSWSPNPIRRDCRNDPGLGGRMGSASPCFCLPCGSQLTFAGPLGLG